MTRYRDPIRGRGTNAAPQNRFETARFEPDDETGFDDVEAEAASLSGGWRKRLAIAEVLVQDPTLVLFDEIMAGLTPTEVRGMTQLVASLPARGITVIWVEHVLYAIMNAAPRIMVLHRGKLIADGAPEKLAKDPAVIKAYFGEEITLA